MKVIRFVVWLLVIIGALNWGLVGFFNYNLVADLFGPTGSKVIFDLVGVAGLFALVRCCCRCCSGKCKCCGKENCQCGQGSSCK